MFASWPAVALFDQETLEVSQFRTQDFPCFSTVNKVFLF